MCEHDFVTECVSMVCDLETAAYQWSVCELYKIEWYMPIARRGKLASLMC